MARITVVGSGYVGLATGACFAHLGHRVVCADVDAERVAQLSGGEVPILEQGLPELIRAGVDGGRLSFELGAAAAVVDCEFVFLCVPTPEGPDGSADLSYVRAAAAEIGPVLPAECVVVTKSTAPVGSTRVVEEALQRDDVAVVSNPEFLREGSAVHDVLHPDRIVIGSDDQSAAGRVAALYHGVDAPMIISDPSTAETIKYAANAFLATKAAFANAVANLCEAVGADVRQVLLGVGADPRIGFEYLKPGPGWGGSCLPKDTRALLRIAADAGYDFSLLRGVIDVNLEQFERVTAKVVRMAGGSVSDCPVAAWGLTFKARTDDLRGSPALEVLRRLRAAGARIRAYDPGVASGPRRPVLDGVELAGDPYAACEGATVLVVLTEWDEFRWLDFAKAASLMAVPRVVDARNLLDPGTMRRYGFTYDGVGRPLTVPATRQLPSFPAEP